jgi:predicted sulfurtransferase
VRKSEHKSDNRTKINPLLGLCFLLLLLVMSLAIASCDPTGIRNITSEELKKMIDGGERFLLVDTRSDFEFRRGTIQGAINIPQEKFDVIEGLLPKNKDVLIVFFCRGYG